VALTLVFYEKVLGFERRLPSDGCLPFSGAPAAPAGAGT